MLLSEKEAAAKWCPESRVINTEGQGGGNRWDNTGAPAKSPNGSTCLASACMAWRWGEDERFQNGTPLPVGSVPGDPEWQEHGSPYMTHNGRMQAWRRALPGRLGFCGKAGKP